uniref:Uncharacterized protein n=1 Tax=Setaria digitata TaxID=48799 RepID=A0A915PHS2_9BILA
MDQEVGNEYPPAAAAAVPVSPGWPSVQMQKPVVYCHQSAPIRLILTRPRTRKLRSAHCVCASTTFM